jgi:hypothetical protein
MRPRSLAVASMIAAAALALCLLVTGWSQLESRLPGGLPAGNALSAACLILAAGAATLLSVRGSAAYWFSVASLFDAFVWLPVSIALAGNLELNFNDATGTAWFVFTAVALVMAFGALCLALVSVLKVRRTTPGSS